MLCVNVKDNVAAILFYLINIKKRYICRAVKYIAKALLCGIIAPRASSAFKVCIYHIAVKISSGYPCYALCKLGMVSDYIFIIGSQTDSYCHPGHQHQRDCQQKKSLYPQRYFAASLRRSHFLL